MKTFAPICLFLSVLFASITGCSNATAIITGKTRPAINPSDVKMYSTRPHEFEDVAIISAQPSRGWSNQAKMDSTITDLRVKAAALGANGILIESTETASNGAVIVPSGNALLMLPVQGQLVKGRAIYVTQE